MAYGRKTGGRQKGTRNKSTVQREAAMREAIKAIEATAGDGSIFAGDAHALLMTIYKNTELPLEMRADAAKAALRFEKPALASTDNRITDTTRYVVALPEGGMSVEEWKAHYAPTSTFEGKH